MPWEPDRYLKFKQERAEPLQDLLKLVAIRPGLSVIDLGCGTGELTAQLAAALPDSHITGIDNSPEMLDKASKLERRGLRFELMEIEAVLGSWDLIFSNAALHWVDNHRTLIPRLLGMLCQGGQLAVQIPSNHRNLAQTAVGEIASQAPFRTAMNGWEWEFPVLPIDAYAELLYLHNGREISIYDKVYPHILGDADEVFDWISGTTMIPYIERLPDNLHDRFKHQVRDRLWGIWQRGPLLYPFRRILFSATIWNETQENTES